MTTIAKRLSIIALALLLAFSAAAVLAGCENAENPVQAFIDERRSDLEEISQEHLEDLGPGAHVDFEAGDEEFIYLYTFGPGPDIEDLREYATNLLEYPSNIVMYENLAAELAQLIELDSLTLTVRYFDSEGELVAERSYESNPLGSATPAEESGNGDE